MPGQSYRTRFPVVALGASAGGLSALQSFFERLPPDAGLAFVVILHLDPEHESHVADLLRQKTPMPVIQVVESVSIEPDHVYVIPPDRNLSTADDRLQLVPRYPAGRGQSPIDLFFRALATSHGPDAIAVILSGTGSDGTQGVRHVKEHGGITMAQTPDDAEYGDMPRSAMGTGMVDRVAPAAELGSRLVEILETGDAIDLARVAAEADGTDSGRIGLSRVFTELRRRTGHDFSEYKRPTVLRRLHRRMQFVGAARITDYVDLLRRDPEEIAALHRDLLISVTNFFRDPEAFQALERAVVPGLFADRTPDDEVRVWAAGCATGEEAYSVAILLHEHAETLTRPPHIQIFATDIDDDALAVARAAIYPESVAADVPERRLARHFTRHAGAFRLNKSIRELVLFANHDLLHDPPFARLDLVVCRNLLIYLEREAQRRVLVTLHYALRAGGALFLGSSESVDPAGELFSAVNKKRRIFLSRELPRRMIPRPVRAGRPSLEPTATEDRGPASAAAAERTRPAMALHHGLLELYAPPSLVVNSTQEVIHLSERAGKFLRVQGGEPSRHLLDMVDGPLKLELRRLLHLALHEGRADEARDVPLELDGRRATVTVAVRPTGATGRERHALVLFEETEAPSEAPLKDDAAPAPIGVIERLEDELRRSQEGLQATIEEYDALVQQLRATNEELQSINEEQKATGEELETSKEELQSVNEELRAVNQERRVKIDELARLNADLRNLINSTQIATIFLDRDLQLRRFTPSVVELFNFVDTDEGRPIDHVTHRLAYPQLADDARRVLDRLDTVEREVEASDGRWFDLRILPYRSLDDRIDGVVLTLVDITGRKRSESERERLLEAARAANDLKGRLISMLSHDFRTPLNAITGYAEVLTRGMTGDLTDKQREKLGRIASAARQLDGMIDDVLAYSRMDTEMVKLNLQTVDAAAVAREVVEMVEPEAARKKLEVRVNLADAPAVTTDPGKLRQVLTNLLTNAVKFTASGHIAVSVQPRDGGIVIEVEDTGPGIEPADRDRIFERFWQRGEESGTGLGLAIVRDLTAALGGTVEIESEPGTGSRFRVLLPRRAPAAVPGAALGQ